MNRFIKPALVLGFAGALALSAVTPSDAQSRRSWRGPGPAIGLAAGAFIAGAAIASANTYYGPSYYEPGYSYGPGYGYGPGPGYAYAPSYGYADVDAYAYAPGPVYVAPAYRSRSWQCNDFQQRDSGAC